MDSEIATTPGKSPGSTMPRSIFLSSAIALVPSGAAVFLLEQFSFTGISWSPLAWAIGSAMFCVIGTKVWVAGLVPEIGTDEMAVGMFLGGPVPVFFKPGRPWRIPGIESVKAVNVQVKTSNPPVFSELALDRNKVFIDGYFDYQVVDPFKWFKLSGETQLTNAFRSRIRHFVNPWKKAIYVSGKSDLLEEYLNLAMADTEATDDDHDLLRIRLMALTVASTVDGVDQEPYLTTDAVKTIMDCAGEFRRTLDSFGVRLIRSKIDQVHVAEELTDAAESLQIFDLQAKLRQQIAGDLLALAKQHGDTTLSLQDVVNIADRGMKNGVTTNILQLDTPNLGSVMSGLDPRTLQALMNLIERNKT